MSTKMISASVFALCMLMGEGSAATPPTPATLAQLAVDVIYLTPYGFFPKQLTVVHGKHLLVVRTVPGLRKFSLNVSLGGLVQAQQAITPSSPRWLQILYLPAGKYTFTEASHANWVCTMTVQ